MNDDAQNAQPRKTTVEQVVAIVLAAGSSARMGGVDKLWAELDGRPLIAHALRAMAATFGVVQVVVVARAEQHAPLTALLEGGAVPVCCVEGGTRRQDSVAAGIAAAPDAAWYLVHDGARPFATPALAARVLDGARTHGAAVPGVSVADTVKRVDTGGQVLETLERDDLRAVQTPQAFRGELLRRAHREIRDDVTDDAAMVERIGGTVVVVSGESANRKVTTTEDLVAARALIAAANTAAGSGGGI